MKQERMDNLSDGIFAIVMTLLVLDLRVPVIVDFSVHSLLGHLVQFIPYLMSYLTSFAVLYSFWHSHHFIASVYAKNLTVKLSSINALFLFFIGLVPFSSHLLGEYYNHPFAIITFGLNIIMIGLVLFYMRQYIKHTKDIESVPFTKTEEMHAQARILFPIVCSALAIGLSFYSTTFSLTILTFGILFNFSRKSTDIFTIVHGFKKHK